MTKCGCERHSVDSLDADVVYYKGRFWTLRCLFLKVDRRMPIIIERYNKMRSEVLAARKMKDRFIKMKKYIRKLPCGTCGKPAGNRAEFSGDMLLCGGCMYQLSLHCCSGA